MDEIDLNTIQALLGEPTAELKHRVEDKLTECISTVEARIKDVKIVRPTVTYDLKGHTAGRAWRDKITLNLDILNDPRYQEDMILQVVPHELAHCVVTQLWPTATPHGGHWAFIMERVLNLPATRCHQYETKAARTRAPKEWHYDCNCPGGHLVSNTIHRRILGGRVYTCKRCRGELR